MKSLIIAFMIMLCAALYAPAAEATVAGKEAVHRYFGSNRRASCIAHRESRFKPWVISSTDDWGLFQFNRPTWSGKLVSYHGVSVRINYKYMLRPMYNAKVAWIITKGGTYWGPWAPDLRYC